jgi:dephospho-CoA kinase
MLKVGLTGGIGSGKTLIGEIFMRLGIPVFNADKESKKIVNSDPEVIEALKKEFGNKLYSSLGVNKKLLAEIIFNDETALKKVNEIIHPRVHDYFKIWIDKNQYVSYVLEEAAILFESKANLDMDFTINVHADELIRIDRVVKRDNIGAELVKSRMKNQLSDNERLTLADFTIYNDGKQMVLPQVLEIHNKIIKSK